MIFFDGLTSQPDHWVRAYDDSADESRAWVAAEEETDDGRAARGLGACS